MCYRLIVSFVIVVGLAASVYVAAAHGENDGSRAVSIEITTRKPADSVKATIEKDRATMEIRSQSGIGGATVELKEGRWPEAIVVRLHLRGLESFSAARGKLKLSGSVTSHSGNPRRLALTEEGVEQERAAGTDIKLFDAVGKPVAKGLPPEGGYFEIELPKALLEGESRTLTLGWIDFFRG